MSAMPLTCFEEYMLWEDRPSHPMLGFGRLRFSGHLHRAAFEAAFSAVLERHMLLRSIVARNRGARPHWVEQPGWKPEVQWEGAAGPHAFPNAPYVDLTQTPGTRLWVIDRGPGHDLVLQMHHCTADGIGIGQVMEDLLIGYALQRGGGPQVGQLQALDRQRLQRRGAPGLTPLRWLGMSHRQAVGLLGVREFLTHRPATLMGKKVADSDTHPSRFPCPRTVELTPQETNCLLSVAKKLGASVNDVLMRDLFLAIASWRKEISAGDDHDWLRISVPMNLRTPDDVQMPMANSVSMVFVDRRKVDMSPNSQLLYGIRRQMQRIKRCRLQYTFLLSLGAARCLPGGLASRTRADVIQTTSCLSNIGIVFPRTPLPRHAGRLVAGDVEVDDVDFVIPLRPHLHGAFCAYTYAGSLRILLHHDPRAMTDRQAQSLLDRYVQHIRASLQRADEPEE